MIFPQPWYNSYVVTELFIAHDKTYSETCATSEDSDQPAHPRNLIRVFADRMYLLKTPGYQKRDKREALPY